MQAETERYVLGRWGFRCLWAIVILIHVTCTVFPALIGWLYKYIPVRAPRIVNNAELYSVSVDRKYYGGIAFCYFAVASVHVLCLANILQLSIRNRRLLLEAPPRRAPAIRLRRKTKAKATTDPKAQEKDGGAKVKDAEPTTAPQQQGAVAVESTKSDRTYTARVLSMASSSRTLSTISRFSTQTMSSVVSAVSVLDVTHPFYDVVHISREMVQTGLLTYQIYKASYLVAVPWMNNTLVVLLVLNCWTFPVIHNMFHSHMYLTRFIGIGINVALDMSMYIVIPVALFTPYYQNYDIIAGSYASNDFWYTDRWLMRVLTEWKMLFITSLADGVSKILIALSISFAMLELPKLVAPQENTESSSAAYTVKATIVSPAGDTSAVKKQLWNGEKATKAKSRFMKVSLGILAIWGTIVGIVHVHAASHGTNKMCVSQVRPWLSKRAACSLLQIDCKVNAVYGNGDEFEKALANIDEEWLSYLVIRHCPNVEITPAMLRLRNLAGFKIFNSTLARWGSDAALTQRNHPLALFVFLAEVNMTALPPGLYDPDYPQLLLDIEICKSNMSTLPQEIAHSWPRGLFLLLEGIEFTSFPDVLSEIQPKSLSLVRSSIQNVPAKLFESPILRWLKISGNAITALPSSVQLVPPLRFFFLQGTQIASLPSWMNLDVIFEAQAGDTPLCDHLQSPSSNVTLTASEAERMKRLRTILNCVKPADRDAMFHFPIGRELINNP
ncbi:hypothetical protein PINS_up002189 [Pythium insidiosum]|nr:hypothetical protein PINS_up002189 [Pythium insidiosum]